MAGYKFATGYNASGKITIPDVGKFKAGDPFPAKEAFADARVSYEAALEQCLEAGIAVPDGTPPNRPGKDSDGPAGGSYSPEALDDLIAENDVSTGAKTPGGKLKALVEANVLSAEAEVAAE